MDSIVKQETQVVLYQPAAPAIASATPVLSTSNNFVRLDSFVDKVDKVIIDLSFYRNSSSKVQK